MKTYDVCIIGGGAAGLIAAASLDPHIRICLLEKNKVLGRKVMATGGGRCNITNKACDNKGITLDFFKSLGLETYCDHEGRYYPYSNQASDVVKILTLKLKQQNIDVMTEAEVTDVICQEGSFFVSDKNGRNFVSSNLILAAGGKAAPHLGTTGDGYVFARALGHKIKKVYPILTGIVCGSFDDIKGVRARGTVSLYKDDRLIKEETGEIQFTEDGLSGICVLNLTLYIKAEGSESLKEALRRYSIMIDLAPDFTQEQIDARRDSFGILSDKLSARVGIEEMKKWKLPILGVKGWKNAQCTAGGVALEEINQDTMESKVAAGLYLAGEMIDYQGPCGGYNLQNAWETGIKAAKAINRRFI